MTKEDKTNNNTKEKSFYPDYLFEIVLVIFFTLELITVLAILWPPKIGRLIDFTAPYQPRPEWYFLWLYQLIRYFPGRWTFVGTVLVPLVAIILLFYIPWIDKRRRGRLMVLLITTVLLFGFIILTILPLL